MSDTRARILAAAEPLVLRHGFAGTSLEALVKAAHVTKGAFFHHFRDKADLARALVEHYEESHTALFERFAREADRSTEDPLDATLAFLRRFEAFVESRTTPLGGCIFAAYAYQGGQFDAAVQALVAAGLKRWAALYEARFAEILARYRPRTAVDAAELAAAIVALIEGGLMLSRAQGDAHLVARLSRQFRNYLALLFVDREPRASAREAAKAPMRG